MTFCFETVCSGFCGYFLGGSEGERSEPDPRVGWRASEVRVSALIELCNFFGRLYLQECLFTIEFTFLLLFLTIELLRVLSRHHVF